AERRVAHTARALAQVYLGHTGVLPGDGSGDDVEDAIAVQVAGRDRGAVAGGERRLRDEAAVPQTEQHADAAAGGVGHREIGRAVFVEVRNLDVIGLDPRGIVRHREEGGGTEVRRPGAEQDADRAVGVLGGDQIGDAVVVEVARGETGAEVADRDGEIRAEGSVADAGRAESRQDTDGAGRVEGSGEIQDPVAVEIGRDDLVRTGTRGIAHRGRERPVADPARTLPDQHRYGIREQVGDGEV